MLNKRPMENGGKVYFNTMAEMLRAKKQLLTEMLTLTKAQTSVIKEGSLDELQKLVDEKQKLIDRIDGIDAKFSDCLQKLKDSVGVNKLDEIDVSRYPEAKQLKEATSEVLDVVREISSIEEINSKKSKELLKQLGSKIQNINRGKKISNAYKKPNTADHPSFFMDRKG